MKTFQKFREGLLKEGYKFIKTSEKPFGLRITAHKGGAWTEKRVLIYWHAKKQPDVADFSNFLSDFERFIKTHKSKYDVEAGFLLVGENCSKKVLQGLKMILKHSSKDLRKRVKIVQLKA